MIIRTLVGTTNQRNIFLDLGYVGKKATKSLNEQDKKIIE